jgi:dinuclear metal center YbgI/SA1388 family protein
MSTVRNIAAYLEEVAPAVLAESWDNVGLLVGDARRGVRRIMTCLTITPASAAEAVAAAAELIVTHHPLPFRPVRRLTTENAAGRLLLELSAARIAVYSPHTAWDSAPQGINQRLAEGLGLAEIAPLVLGPEGQGRGRRGQLSRPLTLGRLAARLGKFLKLPRMHRVGRDGRLVRSVAVACGAADELVEAAVTADCDAMVLGEARFHTCLEAEAAGMGLLLCGHFASERFAMKCLAGMLKKEFPKLDIWASRKERDPLRWQAEG